MPADRDPTDRDPTDRDPTGAALGVLRDVWAARGWTDAELERRLRGPGGRACKNMATIGFGGMADTPAEGDTNVPVDEDVRAAWRDRLARDGKLDPHAESIGALLRRR